MILLRLILLLCLVLFLGNHNNQAQKLSRQQIPSDTVITLERGVCLGACPEYKLTVSADGTVVFEGLYSVKKNGTLKTSISQKKVVQLIAAFEKANYFSLKDEYVSKQDGCPDVWTDQPFVTTSIVMDGKSKSIKHYQGCKGNNGSPIYPKGLTELENKIDKIVGTKRWISK